MNIKKELKESEYILSNINGYSLDIDQRKAVISDKKASLVVAGAGSGKSLTMIGKIRYLIERKNIKENEILCISFTKDASSNLENNIKKNYNYNIKVYTFHKLSLEFIKNSNYNIFDTDLLEYTVSEYFNSIIYNNKDMILNVKKILNKIDTPYSFIVKSKELESLKKTIITFINLFKTNNYSFNHFLKIKNNKEIISIIIDIYYLYEEELKSTNSIDFNDMINLAIDYVKNNKIPMYKHIIVDEYQDTSYIRYLLLKAIIDKTGAKLTCVGDDYQSIYRFNGCDINMFLDFKKLFKGSKIYKIKNTYRNSQELIDVAGSFIMKNKRQLYKKLISSKHIPKPIKIYYGNNIDKIINNINDDDIFILGRNNNDIKKYKLSSNVKFLTVHASKGLEAGHVIVLNLTDNILGFPNKIVDPKILKYIGNIYDRYEYEEERRLFYVALTRTKNEVYLVSDKNNKSVFIKELERDYSKYIDYI